ncbi:MAG: cytochrome D1 [Rubrivivax sp.]|nr:cytochrome D1 [Pyrinomonadaceae bacterium]
MRTTFRIAFLASLCLCAVVDGVAPASARQAGANATQTSATARATQEIVKEGIRVEFTIEPVAGGSVTAGEDATVRFRLGDAATKTPLKGVRPAAWMSLRAGDAAAGMPEQQCRDSVRSYLSGSLRSRPDVDLNGYFVLAMNDEPNVSVIDPLLGFGGSKLLTLISLKSPGEDWALSGDGKRLFISMPAVRQVAVVDTAMWKTVANVDAAPLATAPLTRMRPQPDDRRLWVLNPEGGGTGALVTGEQLGGVTVVDAAGLKVLGRVLTGRGDLDITFSDDSRYAFVASGGSGRLTIIDAATLAKVADVEVAKGSSPLSVAYSPLSKAVYVADAKSGSIAVVDASAHKIIARIEAKPGLSAIRFAPGGRYGFAANAAESVVHVFDASTNRMLHNIAVGKSPAEITFTDAFAYVRSEGTPDVTLIRLGSLAGQPDVSKFPGGQSAPEASGKLVSLSPSIAPAPEGNAVLVANPADKVIYYYAEGMAAPMGNFQNYKRVPRAVMVFDRSLREESPGVYATRARLPKGGKYTVAFLLDQPRIIHCFEAEAKPGAAAEAETKTALRVEYLDKEKPMRVGESYKLRFKLIESATGKPRDALTDVRVLFFLAPGVWQKRDLARAMGGGIYELDVTPPQAGLYMVFIESRSQGIAFRDLPHLSLQAEAPATTP